MKIVYSFARGAYGLFCHYIDCISSYLLINFFERIKKRFVV